MEKKREIWVDNLRGFGIILVVFAHCGYPHQSLLFRYLYTFSVPLFFFTSGFLYSTSKDANFFEYFLRRFNRLIVPYFWFNIMAYIGLGIFIKKYQFFTADGFKYFIINTLYGNYTGIANHTVINASTWFMPCLFLTGLYYYALNKFVSNNFTKLLIIIALSILAFIESKFIRFRLPWGSEIAFMGLFFFGIGNLFKTEIISFINKISNKYLFLVPALVAVNIFLVNSTNMSTNLYSNYINFIFCAATGIFTFMLFSRIIGKSFLSFYGANSIIIIGMSWFQGLLYSFLVFISFHLLPKDVNYFTGTAQFISLLVLMVPIIKLTNKYLYFLIGIRKIPDYKLIINN